MDIPQIPCSRNCGFPLNEEMTTYLCVFELDFVYIVDAVKLFMIFTYLHKLLGNSLPCVYPSLGLDDQSDVKHG